MSSYRLLGSSAAVFMAVLIGGTIITGVSASPAASTAGGAGVPAPAASAAATDHPYCDAYRTALADALGVSEAALADASRKAAATAIDRAVADGRLTALAADKLKARIADPTKDACARFAKRLDRVKPALGVVRDAMTAAADTLGMSRAELRAQLTAGTSLPALASSKGVDYATLTAAIVAAVKVDLDRSVAAGTIPRARADRVLTRLQTRLAAGKLRETD